MKILAATPSKNYGPTTYIAELTGEELAALTVLRSHEKIPVTREGWSSSTNRENCDCLMAGDIISPDVFKERSAEIVSLIYNDEELKKAINFVRGAMTKIENALITKKEGGEA